MKTLRLQIIFLLAGLMLCSGWAHAQSARRLNNQGVADYKEGNYLEALKKFRRASESMPENLPILYNIAAAQAASTQTVQQAMENFAKASEARDISVANRARFAQGVIHYAQAQQKRKAQDLQGALESVKAAEQDNRAVLGNAPEDADARINYELASVLKKKIEKELEQQKQQQKQQQDQKDQQQKQDQQNQDKQQDNQQKQEEQKQNQDQQQQPQPTATPTPAPQQQNGQASPTPTPQNQNDGKQNQTGQATPTPAPTPEQQDKQSSDKKDQEKQQKPSENEKVMQQNAKKNDKTDEQKAMEAMLNTLNEDDAKLVKQMLKQRYGNMPQPEKDW